MRAGLDSPHTSVLPGDGQLRDGPAAPALDQDVKAALRQAEHDPPGLSDDQALAVLGADGPALEALTKLADDIRRGVRLTG